MMAYGSPDDCVEGILRNRRDRFADRREFIAAAMDAVGEAFGRVAPFRDVIARAAGRGLLLRKDVEWLLRRYDGFYGDDPDSPYRMMRALSYLAYGEGWQQRWYLGRDLVVATREVRAKARAWRRSVRRCAICGAALKRPLRYVRQYYEADHLHATHEFYEEIARKHYRYQPWELPRKQRLRRTLDKRNQMEDLARYRKEHRPGSQIVDGIPGLVCGWACEATRFSRWYGRREQRYREYWKARKREQKEWEWIQKGKRLLREARVILAPKASSSPPKGSTRALSSPAS
jgi:hypothetical protein